MILTISNRLMVDKYVKEMVEIPSELDIESQIEILCKEAKPYYIKTTSTINRGRVFEDYDSMMRSYDNSWGIDNMYSMVTLQYLTYDIHFDTNKQSYIVTNYINGILNES